MHITHIQLKNWKNFLEVDVPLGDRVFLIGPNASGKSNFLDALRFMRDIALNGLDKAVTVRGGMKSIRCLSARKNPNVLLMLTIDGIWNYELELTHRDISDRKQVPVVQRELVRKNGETILNRPDPEDARDPQRLVQTALEQVSANQKFRELADFFKTVAYRHVLPQVVRDPQGFSSKPVEDDPFGRDIVRQIWNTPKRTRTARLKRMEEALQLAVPNLSELAVDMEQTSGRPHLKVKYNHWRAYGAIQDETAFSDGTLRLLVLLWMLLERGGPLLLEEPELSLHEEVVRQLPAMFARLVRGQARRQALISTHSRAMLSDVGISSDEILMLAPTDNGTTVHQPEEMDVKLMEQGLSAADVLLPKTQPQRAMQLSLLKL